MDMYVFSSGRDTTVMHTPQYTTCFLSKEKALSKLGQSESFLNCGNGSYYCEEKSVHKVPYVGKGFKTRKTFQLIVQVLCPSLIWIHSPIQIMDSKKAANAYLRSLKGDHYGNIVVTSRNPYTCYHRIEITLKE